MFRTVLIFLSLTVVFLALNGASTGAIGAEPNAQTALYDVCNAGDGGAALFIHVENIRSVEGNLRAQVYSSDPEDFLAKGKKLVRVDVPVKLESEQSVCVPVPAPGKYAFVVMHDRNANGKADFFSEGFGFTNNPALSLGPPDAEDVMFEVPEGVKKTSVRLKYILGSDDEGKKKRRKLKRR